MSGEPHMTLHRWLWLGLYCFGGLGLSRAGHEERVLTT